MDLKGIKIVYWSNIPAPYMVDRFNALAKRGKFDFEVWFNDREASDRSWAVNEEAWLFRYKYIPSIRLFGRTFHFCTPLFFRRVPNILISLYAEPVFVVGWAIAHIRGAKTVFRVLITYDRWFRRRWYKEILKRFMFKRVSAIETPGNDGKNYAISSGADQNKIYIATHTVDIEYVAHKSILLTEERNRLRDANQLKGTVFLYVGRLWWGKGIEYLLEAFNIVQQQCQGSTSLLLLGDGAAEEGLKQICNDSKIKNVIFAGYIQKNELPIYYGISDVFVFPTLGDPYGIVVDEAMACALPIISTTEAGEIRDRVKDDENGYIVQPEDSAGLANAMLKLVDNQPLRRQMGEKSRQIISNHTPEQWAIDIENMVLTLVGQPHTVKNKE